MLCPNKAERARALSLTLTNTAATLKTDLGVQTRPRGDRVTGEASIELGFELGSRSMVRDMFGEC